MHRMVHKTRRHSHTQPIAVHTACHADQRRPCIQPKRSEKSQAAPSVASCPRGTPRTACSLVRSLHTKHSARNVTRPSAMQ